ncbi:MAG: hypothetical protein Q8R15_00130 [Candidatus Micrarchaeota archaeon]|nr:hypothetical protein [Candidatus Micrarchaeota archaeon]
MAIWIFVLLLAAAILGALILRYKPKKEKLLSMAKAGLFVAVFDWVVQTLGFYGHYWWTNGGFLIGPAVALEVSLIAFCAGAALNLLRSWSTWQNAILVAIPIGIVGAFIEFLFVSIGAMTYSNGWTSLHAFVIYFPAFVLFQFVNNKL